MHLIFTVTCAILCIRCGLKSVCFSNFGLFLLSPKLIFPFFWAKFLIIELVFSLFWVGFSSQHLLGLLNFFFFLKTRVIKLLIIYLILKIINILIYRESVVRCGLCGFLTIKPQIALHHTVWCNAVHYYLRCGTVIPFYERFWFSFCGLCCLCGLVNTPY